MWVRKRKSKMNSVHLSMIQGGYHPNLHFLLNEEHASLTSCKFYGVHITRARDRRNRRLHSQQRLTNQWGALWYSVPGNSRYENVNQRYTEPENVNYHDCYSISFLRYSFGIQSRQLTRCTTLLTTIKCKHHFFPTYCFMHCAVHFQWYQWRRISVLFEVLNNEVMMCSHIFPKEKITSMFSALVSSYKNKTLNVIVYKPFIKTRAFLCSPQHVVIK